MGCVYLFDTRFHTHASANFEKHIDILKGRKGSKQIEKFKVEYTTWIKEERIFNVKDMTIDETNKYLGYLLYMDTDSSMYHSTMWDLINSLNSERSFQANKIYYVKNDLSLDDISKHHERDMEPSHPEHTPVPKVQPPNQTCTCFQKNPRDCSELPYQ